MREAEFEIIARARGLSERTIQQRIYALKRIERMHGVDLDAEFRHDRLARTMASLTYTAQDVREGRPNPSRLDIDRDRLLIHLRWYRSHLADYLRFCGGEADGEAAEESDLDDELLDETVGRTFALERDLQAALRQNLGQLEEGLTVADGGSEKKVEAGFIDILARDRDGVLTVIELKAETARPDAIAQVLSYMGALTAETGERVRGILVAADHHPRVVLAARVIDGLVLRKYRFRFAFE